jgi:hypothetical protein
MAYSPSAVVDVYDENLTRAMFVTLSAARTYLSATSIGNYALFAGGITSDRYSSDIVDAYKCF